MGNYLWSENPQVSVDLFIDNGRRLCVLSVPGHARSILRFYCDTFAADDLAELSTSIDSGSHPLYIDSVDRKFSIYVQDAMINFVHGGIQTVYPVGWFRGVFARVIHLIGYDTSGGLCGDIHHYGGDPAAESAVEADYNLTGGEDTDDVDSWEDADDGVFDAYA